MAQKGLRGLTFRSLAAEAGVSPTLPAHYFGTRDTIIKETLSWVVKYSVASTHLARFTASEREYEDALVASLKDEPDIHAFQIEMILEAHRRPELQPAVSKLYSTYLQAMQTDAEFAGLTNISDAKYRTVFACIDGLILQYLSGAITDAQLRESASLAWSFIGAEPGTTRHEEDTQAV